LLIQPFSEYRDRTSPETLFAFQDGTVLHTGVRRDRTGVADAGGDATEKL